MLLEQGLSLVEEFWAGLSLEDELLAPPLLRPECTSIIRREVFERRIEHDDGRRLIDELAHFPFLVVTSTDHFIRAFELAARFQHKKAYDMQYLAVAELEGAELMTVDRGLRHAAQSIGVPVHYLR